jgi:hypothetical protein
MCNQNKIREHNVINCAKTIKGTKESGEEAMEEEDLEKVEDL